MSEELITAEEAAVILKLNVETVREYIRKKQLPAYRVGRGYLIKRSDIDKFLEQRRTDKEED